MRAADIILQSDAGPLPDQRAYNDASELDLFARAPISASPDLVAYDGRDNGVAPTAEAPGNTVVLDETLSLAEAIVSKFNAFTSVNETLSLSESIASKYNAKPTVNETLSLSESLASKYNAKPTVTETLTLSESITSKFSASVALVESIALTESLAAMLRAAITLSESMSVSESVNSQYKAYTGLSETISLVENIVARQQSIAGISESFSLNEALAAAYVAVSTLNESWTFGEEVSVVYTPYVPPAPPPSQVFAMASSGGGGGIPWRGYSDETEFDEAALGSFSFEESRTGEFIRARKAQHRSSLTEMFVNPRKTDILGGYLDLALTGGLFGLVYFTVKEPYRNWLLLGSGLALGYVVYRKLSLLT